MDASVRPKTKNKYVNKLTSNNPIFNLKPLTSNTAITLVALVITIIVLLILAGVTLNMVIGENGLFSNAKKSSEETKMQSALEELNLKIMDVQTIKTGEVTLQDIVEALKNDEQYTYIVNLSETAFLSNEGEIVSDSDIAGKITNDVTSIRVIHKGYEFEINNNLKVSYIGSKGVQQKKKYTISLDANGGTITENEIKIMNGDLYGDLPEPTRENCNFEGWYTSKKVSEGTKIEATDEFSLEEDQTLYAIWSHTHTVASGATLVSGTALDDGATYSESGGCYTTASTTSKTCGSTSWTISSWGMTPQYFGERYCDLCGKTVGKYYCNNSVAVCNSCNVKKTCSNTLYLCFNGHIYDTSFSSRVNLSYYFGTCTNTVTKTYYSRSCGLSSGILDQD